MTQVNPKKLSVHALAEWLKDDTKYFVLVDVREKAELRLAPFPYEVIHLPLSDCSNWQDSLFELLSETKSIVVFCHAGIRSLNFSQWLLNQKPDLEVWNLTGGIDAWSREIDSSVHFY